MATPRKKGPPARQSKSAASGKSTKTQNGSANHEAAPTVTVFPTIEEIRIRAYHLYLERGATHGRDREDWFVAEKLLSEARAKPA